MRPHMHNMLDSGSCENDSVEGQPSSEQKQGNTGLTGGSHNHDCNKHKIRRRIQFYRKEKNEKIDLLFQFKHAFCDENTFCELIEEIRPKLGKKIEQLNDSEYLMNCLSNGQITLYSHDGKNSDTSNSSNIVKNWDEILDFDENVIDIVIDVNEILAFLQNEELSTVRNQANNNNDYVSTSKENDEMDGGSGGSAGGSGTDAKMAEEEQANEAVSKEKMQDEIFSVKKGLMSLKVRYWNDLNEFDECRIDMPSNSTMDELKHQLSNIMNIKNGYRNHSSNILSSLYNNNKYLYSSANDELMNEHCLCSYILEKCATMSNGNKMKKNDKSAKSENNGKTEKFEENTIYFYDFLKHYENDKEALKEIKVNNVDFENVTVKQLCQRISKENEVSFSNVWLCAKSTKKGGKQDVTFNINSKLSDLGFCNNKDENLNIFYTCGIASHLKNKVKIDILEMDNNKIDLTRICDLPIAVDHRYIDNGSNDNDNDNDDDANDCTFDISQFESKEWEMHDNDDGNSKKSKKSDNTKGNSNDNSMHETQFGKKYHSRLRKVVTGDLLTKKGNVINKIELNDMVIGSTIMDIKKKIIDKSNGENEKNKNQKQKQENDEKQNDDHTAAVTTTLTGQQQPQSTSVITSVTTGGVTGANTKPNTSWINKVKMGDIRIVYQIPASGALITLDDSTKLYEFGVIDNLKIYMYNVARLKSHKNGGYLFNDTTIDLFSHSMQLMDKNPFELIENVISNPFSTSVSGGNNSNNSFIIYANARCLYNTQACEMDGVSKSKSDYRNLAMRNSNNLRLDHCWMPVFDNGASCMSARGMAAFLSVLRLLQLVKDDESGENEMKHNILGRIYTLVPEFPCFVLSFKLLLFDKFGLQLNECHKSLLSNGFYHIARKICPMNVVPNNQVFEQFHVIMSHIIQCSVSHHGELAKEYFKSYNLICPNTLERLINPVKVMNENGGLSEETYSKANIREMDKYKEIKEGNLIAVGEIDYALKLYPKCDEVAYFNFNNLDKDKQLKLINFMDNMHNKEQIDGNEMNKLQKREHKRARDKHNKNKHNNKQKDKKNDKDEKKEEEDDNDNDNDNVFSTLFSMSFDDLCSRAGLGGKNGIMKIIPTLSILDLSQTKSKVLTVDTDGNLCVCLGIRESFHNVGSDGMDDAVFTNNRLFFRPLYNDKIKDEFDLHDLADKVSQNGIWPVIYKSSKYDDIIDDRVPIEAIIVCFDRSGSMDKVFEKSHDGSDDNDEAFNTHYCRKNTTYHIGGQCITGSEAEDTFSVQIPPKHGTVQITNGNYITYTPRIGFTGKDTFNLSFESKKNGIIVKSGSVTMYTIIVKDNVIGCEKRKRNSLTRLKTSTLFFNAFINRSAAYDYANHIGLIVFNDKIDVACELSPLFEKFNRKCDDIYANGETKLRDAMDLACDKLMLWKDGNDNKNTGISNTFTASDKTAKEQENITKQIKVRKQRRKNAKLRIIVLSDGADNGSIKTTYNLTRKLLTNDITVDCVCIGESNNDLDLRAICRSTGGYAFVPKTFRDGLRIFECETFITQLMRPETNPHQLKAYGLTKYQIDCLKYVSPDIVNDTIVPRSKVNDKMNDKSQSLSQQMNNVSNNKAYIRGINKNMRLKRIMKEMKDLYKNPHSNWDIYPNENDLTFWKLVMEGPEWTPYEGGTWLLYLSFDNEYPMKAPKMRFDTSSVPIKHVNINGHGRICHSIFGRDYSPDTSIRDILNHVYGLLLHPDWDDPLDSVLRQQWADNRESFEDAIRQHTADHAFRKRRKDYKKEFEKDEKEAKVEPQPRKRGSLFGVRLPFL